MELAIQGSEMGLPEEKTTTVGTPVAAMALTRGPWAPTRLRVSTSTCSPVLAVYITFSQEFFLVVWCLWTDPRNWVDTYVALYPSHSSFWSLDHVPTTTMATSDFFAASTASAKPDWLLLQRLHPWA